MTVRAHSRATQIAPCKVAQANLGIGSIEAWPAAGGGLLVGIAEPFFVGPAALRPVVKTAFVRLDFAGEISVILPYVTLEPEARGCVRALVAGEMDVPEESISILDRPGDGRYVIIDVEPSAERSLQACGATVRAQLVAAAASAWRVAGSRCDVAQGAVYSGRRAVRYKDIAATAALEKVPNCLQLRCGLILERRAVGAL